MKLGPLSEILVPLAKQLRRAGFCTSLVLVTQINEFLSSAVLKMPYKRSLGSLYSFYRQGSSGHMQQNAVAQAIFQDSGILGNKLHILSVPDECPSRAAPLPSPATQGLRKQLVIARRDLRGVIGSAGSTLAGPSVVFLGASRCTACV